MTETIYNSRTENHVVYHTSNTVTEDNYKFITTHIVCLISESTKYQTAVFNQFGDLIDIYGIGACNTIVDYSGHNKDHRGHIAEFFKNMERVKKYEDAL